MFTGLIETTGTIREASGRTPRRITIASSIPVAETELGASVAIDGCCLTVVSRSGDKTLTFEAATETLGRTTLGRLRVGDTVNLERALRLGDRLGGHFVSGHIDAVGTVRTREPRGSAIFFGIEAPREVLRLTAPRGSICVSGVSLTVTDVRDGLLFVGIIPHTMEVTTFGRFEVGTEVNLEADMLARYIAGYIAPYIERLGQAQSEQPGDERSGLTVEFLKDKGFA